MYFLFLSVISCQFISADFVSFVKLVNLFGNNEVHKCFESLIFSAPFKANSWNLNVNEDYCCGGYCLNEDDLESARVLREQMSEFLFFDGLGVLIRIYCHFIGHCPIAPYLLTNLLLFPTMFLFFFPLCTPYFSSTNCSISLHPRYSPYIQIILPTDESTSEIHLFTLSFLKLNFITVAFLFLSRYQFNC